MNFYNLYQKINEYRDLSSSSSIDQELKNLENDLVQMELDLYEDPFTKPLCRGLIQKLVEYCVEVLKPLTQNLNDKSRNILAKWIVHYGGHNNEFIHFNIRTFIDELKDRYEIYHKNPSSIRKQKIFQKQMSNTPSEAKLLETIKRRLNETVHEFFNRLDKPFFDGWGVPVNYLHYHVDENGNFTDKLKKIFGSTENLSIIFNLNDDYHDAMKKMQTSRSKLSENLNHDLEYFNKIVGNLGWYDGDDESISAIERITHAQKVKQVLKENGLRVVDFVDYVKEMLKELISMNTDKVLNDKGLTIIAKWIVLNTVSSWRKHIEAVEKWILYQQQDPNFPTSKNEMSTTADQYKDIIQNSLANATEKFIDFVSGANWNFYHHTTPVEYKNKIIPGSEVSYLQRIIKDNGELDASFSNKLNDRDFNFLELQKQMINYYDQITSKQGEKGLFYPSGIPYYSIPVI